MSDAPRSIVEEAIGDMIDDLYRALLKQGKGDADAFFAGAILANLLLDDPLLHDATRAILLTSADDNPRGVALVSEVHQRIKALQESQPETREDPDAAK